MDWRVRQVLPFAPKHLFDLVCDIAAYPDFLPFCLTTRVNDHGHGDCVATMTLGGAMVRVTLDCRVSCVFPHIAIRGYGPLVGVFDALWTFSEHREGCMVAFVMTTGDHCVLPPWFWSSAHKRVSAAFRARAHDLKGKNGCILPIF